MKKLFLTFCLMIAMTVPAFANDVFLTTEIIDGAEVRIYAMDETLYSRNGVYGVDIKMVYPDGEKNAYTTRFTKEPGGWTAQVENRNFGYIVDWPGYVESTFDWVIDRVYLR